MKAQALEKLAKRYLNPKPKTYKLKFLFWEPVAPVGDGFRV